MSVAKLVTVFLGRKHKYINRTRKYKIRR